MQFVRSVTHAAQCPPRRILRSVYGEVITVLADAPTTRLLLGGLREVLA
jgi:hypothetical protein